MTDAYESVETRVYPWAEVADYYRKISAERCPPGLSYAEKRLRSIIRDPGGWSGADSRTILRLLDEGCDFPDDARIEFPELETEGIGTRYFWNDEDGDYDHAEFLSGESDYYLDRRQDRMKPGISVHVMYDGNACMPARVLAEYGAWVGAALASIQASGCDMALRIEVGSRNARPCGRSIEAIQVKRFGEELIPRDFAVIFSPGGLRHIMFSAIVKPDKHGVPAAGLGGAAGSDAYTVDWDPDARVLTIGCDANADEFPAKRMSEELAAIRTQL